jgi:hypothetical protein
MNKDRLQMYISVTKIAIVLCWLSLFAFWALKIFGGNFFEIMVENENFLKFSQAVQNTWLKYIGSFLSTALAYYFLYGAVFKRVKFERIFLLFYIISVISVWCVSNFVRITFIQFSFGYSVIILSSLIINKRISKLNGFICVFLDFVFSTVSMLTKSIELSFIQDYLILMIGTIDLHIMYSLYFLYSILIKMKRS